MGAVGTGIQAVGGKALVSAVGGPIGLVIGLFPGVVGYLQARQVTIRVRAQCEAQLAQIMDKCRTVENIVTTNTATVHKLCRAMLREHDARVLVELSNRVSRLQKEEDQQVQGLLRSVGCEILQLNAGQEG